MPKTLPDLVREFLLSNKVLQVATVSRDGKPHVATVYYLFGGEFIYFPARSDSARVKNIATNPNIALVITDPQSLITLQIEGTGELVEDIKSEVSFMKFYSKMANEENPLSFPPILKTKGSGFRVIKCRVSWFRYSDFSGRKQLMLDSKL